MNGYEPPLVETDGGPMCRDCMQWCLFGTRMLAGCDVDGCSCQPCAEARRAVELDDRPPGKLTVIAADMDAERYDVEQLMTERYGRKPRAA